VGAEYPVTLCDLDIFADQAAEPVPSQDPDIMAYEGRMLTPGGQALDLFDFSERAVVAPAGQAGARPPSSNHLNRVTAGHPAGRQPGPRRASRTGGGGHRASPKIQQGAAGPLLQLLDGKDTP
jgi:hypothetical protein